MLYFSETTLFSVQSSSAKNFDFDFCISTQFSVLFWHRFDDLFFSCEFALQFINQITVWIDDSFFCVDELSFHRRFWSAWARKFSIFDFWLVTQSSVKLLSRMRACFDCTIVLYNLSIDLIYHMLRYVAVACRYRCHFKARN